MCEKSKCCKRPELLKGTPDKCSPEQIKECHGDKATHDCEAPNGDRDKVKQT
jgi:hypothetical protein